MSRLQNAGTNHFMQETEIYLAILASASDRLHDFMVQEIGLACNDNLFCTNPVKHKFVDNRANMLRRSKYTHARYSPPNSGWTVIEERNDALLVRRIGIE